MTNDYGRCISYAKVMGTDVNVDRLQSLSSAAARQFGIAARLIARIETRPLEDNDRRALDLAHAARASSSAAMVLAQVLIEAHQVGLFDVVDRQ